MGFFLQTGLKVRETKSQVRLGGSESGLEDGCGSLHESMRLISKYLALYVAGNRGLTVEYGCRSSIFCNHVPTLHGAVSTSLFCRHAQNVPLSIVFMERSQAVEGCQCYQGQLCCVDWVLNLGGPPKHGMQVGDWWRDEPCVMFGSSSKERLSWLQTVDTRRPSVVQDRNLSP